jgi:hypothetical protein
MGIKVEFNPDLALRAFRTPNRKSAKCLPEKLEIGRNYVFLKEGQRNYWLEGEIPLLETKGNQELSRPLAVIRILEAKHFVSKEDSKVYTSGQYLVINVCNQDKIYFNGFERLK